jgi:DMSO reductase anchor subunit
MCSDRLAGGEAPACVQACPNNAIRITLVDSDKIVEDAESNLFLPGAPDPGYTLPTTNYVTRRSLPRNLLPADHYAVTPQHSHPPLVVMLVLTQLSVGAFLLGWVMEVLLGASAFDSARAVHAGVALLLGLTALGASVLHLGRPLYAFRAIIGLRTSWLSREIVAFGAFAGLAVAYAGAVAFGGGGQSLHALHTGVVATGLLGVFCSAMVYHDTRRPFWSLGRSGVKFLLTTVLLGLSTVLLTAVIASTADQQTLARLALGLALTGTLKMICDASVLLHLRDRQATPLKRTARLIVGQFRGTAVARLGAGAIGGIAIPLLLMTPDGNQSEVGHMVAVALILVLTVAGEFLERHLFFTAVVAPKMPGGIG